MAGEGNETASKAWRLQAHTDIWTGDHAGKPDRLITTGLLGSIRWWCEVIVRGLGGSGCDPSNTQARCPDRQGRRCVVCELFGCTSWARKFRFDVLDANGRAQQQQIKKGGAFSLAFTPLRPIRSEEWTLLDATIRLIADYAAIGGKTVCKPSDENGRENEVHHRDYGIVSLEQPAVIAPLSRAQLQTYVRDQRWRRVEHDGFAWASLDNFWSVSGRYLARQDASRSTFNRVIGRPETKRSSPQGDSWLAGRRASSRQQPESKKVFSVKQPGRTFGFVKPGVVTLDHIRKRLETVWGSGSVSDDVLLTGSTVLDGLWSREATP
jgi:CRISPR-associated protein Cmr1